MEATSVIMPTFNRAHLIKETLDAVLGQSLPPAQVIVVNDGSSDDTANVVSAYGDRVTLINKQNSGKPASINLGMTHVVNPLIWICDDDDLPHHDALERLTRLLADNPGMDLAIGRQDRFTVDEETGEITRLGTGYWRFAESDHFLTATLEDFYAHQFGMLVRKSLYDRVGEFDTTLINSEDYDMLIRLAREGRAAITHDVVFDQRVHSGLRGQANYRYTSEERFKVWVKCDQQIFAKVRKELDLIEYLPFSQREAAGTDPVLQRRALLQRGVVMARRKMWTEAIEDWTSAANSGVETPLESEDKAILKRALHSKYGIDEVLESESIFGRLRTLSSLNRPGAEIVAGVRSGLHWRIREALENRMYKRAFQLTRRALPV